MWSPRVFGFAGYCTRPELELLCSGAINACPVRLCRVLVPGNESTHTAIMNLKTAASLALAGMLLLTILAAADFIKSVSGALNDVTSVMALLRSLVILLASLGLTAFFYVFGKAQTR